MKQEAAQAIHDAIGIADGQESARRVKSIVASALGEADRSAKIVFTHYFNHTYVPDLVLEWPNRGAGTRRGVFLRPSGDPHRIRNDVATHASEHPMFLRLSAFEYEQFDSGERDSVASLAADAKESRSLVTEFGALDELRIGSSPAADLLPASILRSGMGLLEEETARSTASVVDTGFNGALSANRLATANALEAIEAVLETGAASELSIFLETMWIASGSAPEDFPGLSHDLNGSMPPGRLQSLLDAISPDRVDFWERIGRSVDFDSFDGLQLVGDQPALQILVSAALPNLRAHACRLLPWSPLAEEGARVASGDHLWQIENGLIGLRTRSRQAWVGLRNQDLPRVATGSDDYDRCPSPTVLAKRAKKGAVSIRQVGLVGGGKVLSYRPETQEEEIAHDELGSTFDAALGADPKVTDAAALVGSKYLDIEFQNLIASGRTNAKFTMSSLIWTTWVMLGDSDDEELAALRAFLMPPEADEESATVEADQV